MQLLGAVIPLFAIMAVGYAASAYHAFQETAVDAINAFVYYIALPALLFSYAAKADLAHGIPWSFIPANVIGIIIAYSMGVLGARLLFGYGSPTAVVVGMISSYGNVAYLGVPLLVAARGTEAAFPAALGQLIHNLLVMAAFPALASAVRTRRTSTEVGFSLARNISRRALTNPVALSTAIGLAAAALPVNLPTPLWKTIDLLAGAAAPAALFVLGLTLHQALRSVRERTVRLAPLGYALTIKLLIQPMIALALVTVVWPMPPTWAYVTVVMSALPNAITAYVLAQQFHTYVQETAAAVVFSTLAAVASLSILTTLIPL